MNTDCHPFLKKIGEGRGIIGEGRWVNYISEEIFQDFDQKAILIGKMLGSLIKARSTAPASHTTHRPHYART
jgi:hypothetical protein